MVPLRNGRSREIRSPRSRLQSGQSAYACQSSCQGRLSVQETPPETGDMSLPSSSSLVTVDLERRRSHLAMGVCAKMSLI